MGKVLDVRWHFLEPGDHFLGRALVGMDKKAASFGNLPPHWKLSNIMKNEDIAAAMCFFMWFHFEQTRRN